MRCSRAKLAKAQRKSKKAKKVLVLLFFAPLRALRENMPFTNYERLPVNQMQSRRNQPRTRHNHRDK